MNAPRPLAADAALAETSFAVPSIRCAGCISKIEDGLPLNRGIAGARVNFTAKRVTVIHDAAFDMPRLHEAFEKLGFEAQPVDIAAAGEDSESCALLRAMAVAGFAAMNIILLSVSIWSGAEGTTRELFHWLSALIALPTIAYSGRVFFKSAWNALRNRRTNMDVPISIGVLLTACMSLYETMTGGPHAYFDGAVMLLFFLLTGRWLDSVMRDRARDGVAALLKQAATGALVLKKDGSTEWRAAQDLAPNMRMIVAAGERLGADGVVEQGTTTFDFSLLTGESAPQPIGPGDTVHAGTLNIGAPITVRVTRAGTETALADIARMMEAAAQSRSRYVRVADRAARLYAPAVHTLALLSFLGWMSLGAGWHASLLIAAAVLIITCPCALGLAVPAAQIVAVGALMREGVLVKDGSALERLAEADCAVFDKTGTLTLGRPEPIDLDELGAEQKSVLLGLARASRHPLSQALRRCLEQQGISAEQVSDIIEVPGFGLTGNTACGIASISRADGDKGTELACSFRLGDLPPAIIRFRDRLRPKAAATLSALNALGLESSILSGDRAQAVAPIAAELGIPARTDLTPGGKLDAIKQLAGQGARVLMIGDGLNDGPALAAGHVSMAPASASDAGQNAADAVWMGDGLAPVAKAIKAARRTMHIVRQNFAFAIGYNAIAVPLAIMGRVTPLIAALAMSGSSIIVIANALRLRSAAR